MLSCGVLTPLALPARECTPTASNDCIRPVPENEAFLVWAAGGAGGTGSGHGMLGALGMPFVRGANLRASSSSSSGGNSPSSYGGVGAFANSPVNGLLYMRGKIGARPLLRRMPLNASCSAVCP